MKFGQKSLFVSLYLFLNIVTFAQQQYEFKRLTVRNGLAHNNIYTLFQDKSGFIWAGTQSGLSKFDGYSFHNYYHNPNDSTTLISDNFGFVFEDSKERIWLGTYNGGLACYERKTSKITNFTTVENRGDALPSNMIRGIVEDAAGGIWIASSLGLCLFLENGKFETYTSAPENIETLSSPNIKAIDYDEDGYIWVATSNGLNRFDVKTKKNKRISVTDKSDGIVANSLQAVFSDSKDRIWIGTRDNGLYIYVKKLDNFVHYPPGNTPETVSDARIQTITEDIFGNFWIGTYEHGLNLYNSETGKFSEISYSKDNPNSLSNNTIETIIEDNAANLWVGTRGGGINILDLKPAKFSNIDLQTLKLNSNSVQSIEKETETVLWLGTKSGLVRYDTQNGKQTVYSADKKVGSLGDDRIRALLFDDGRLWVGTYERGLYVVNTQGSENKKFINIGAGNKSENNLVSQGINTLARTDDGSIWVGHIDGLSKINYQSETNYTVQTYSNSKDEAKVLSDDYVTDIFQDSKGLIWILTSGGLNLYRPATNDFEQIYNRKEGSQKAEETDNSFTQMFETHDGRLWIGTAGAGLLLFNPDAKTFTRPIKTSKAMSNIMSISADKSGNLWLSTSDGISKLDINTLATASYGIDDGLKETGFNRNSALRMRNGTLLFGHISGYTVIRPENIKLNEHKPKVVLTDFKIFNKSIFQNKNSFASELPENILNINLTYNDYVVAFDFAALDLTKPDANKFAYMLEGYKDEWIEFGTQHQFMFTNLPAGKYILRVKATNNDNLWCDTEDMAAIQLYVKPPFWKTWWFLLTVIVVVSSLVFWFFKNRTKKLRLRNQILEQKVEERTRALKDTNIELEKLSIVARETDNSVTILDKYGNFEWFNEGFSKIFGYNTLKDFTDDRGLNILVGKFDDEVRQTVRTVIETKQTIVRSNKVSGRDKKVIWLQTTWTPILDDNGEIYKLIAVDTDISELKNVEELVMAKNDELEQQNEAIKRYSENVRSSIEYAKTIQNSILPYKKWFKAYSEPLVYYCPKDIVSGDFYWTIETDKYYFTAVVDCTGHGVPGAFMSLIGSRLLKEIVKDMHITKPNDILIRLNTSVIQALNQDESNNRDGMDVSVLRVSKALNENGSRSVIFAGAKQDIFVYINELKKLFRIRGTRKGIGGKSGTNPAIMFKNERFSVQKDDVIYLMTDGYKDQNNLRRERFGTERMMTLLNELAPLKAAEQEVLLKSVLEKFREGEPARDDITILGLKIL